MCGNGPRAASLTRALARAARVRAQPLPAARLTTAAAVAASAQRIERSWRALGEVDAVVILPSLPIGQRRRNPGLAAWRAGLASTVRAGYVAARAAGLALAAQGRGVLVIVNAAAAAGARDDAVAAVAIEALSCLRDALARALADTVAVVEVTSGSGRGAEAALARAVLALLAGAPTDPLPSVRSGAGSRG